VDDVPALLVVAGAVGLSSVSPGPTSVVVARTALVGGARAGRDAAFGVGVISVVMAAAIGVGIGLVQVFMTWLFLTLKFAGGVYLIWLGVQMWRAHLVGALLPGPAVTAVRSRSFGSAVSGALAQVSNPKVWMSYGVVLATLLPTDASPGLLATAALVTGATELVWFMVMAIILSRPPARRFYERHAATIDRTGGVVLAGLGAYFTGEAIWSLLAQGAGW
jgi:threonine/homoserine/homoserine lactone efflux protein